MYYAGRDLYINKDLTRKVGEAVPEAKKWSESAIENMLRCGDLRVDDGAEYVAGRRLMINGVEYFRGDKIPDGDKLNNMVALLKVGDVKKVYPPRKRKE